MKKGSLYLIPSPLGDNAPEEVMPHSAFPILASIEIFIVEEVRTARRFLRKSGYNKPFEDVTFLELNEHTDLTQITSYLDGASSGKDIGLISEAGLPCIADPGNAMVMIAHQLGVRVIPLVGPSSLLLALMASGLNGQQFEFLGYLPVKTHERVQMIRSLDRSGRSDRKSRIFIEAPYRNLSLLESLTKTCSDETLLCIAADLTLDSEFIRTLRIAEWKRLPPPPIQKHPTVFILGW